MDDYTIKYWNLSGDPFFTSPLFRNDIDFYKLFIKTQEIKDIEQKFLNNIKSKHSKKVVILGGRGAGKSTILNYLYNLCCMKSQTKLTSNLPIFMTVKDIWTYSSEKGVTQAFYKEALKATERSLKDENINPYRDATTKFEEKISECIRFKYDLLDCIEDVFPNLFSGEYFTSSTIFIDNLDKINDLDLLENWLTHSQAFFEEILWKNNIHTVVGGGAFFIQKSSLYDEYSWFFEDNIKIGSWAPNEISDLIDKRLKYKTQLEKYYLDKYFEQSAINEIYRNCLGNPRICQSACKYALVVGAQNKVRHIDFQFLKNNHRIFTEVLGHDEKTRRRTILDYLQTSNAYQTGMYKISNILKNNKKDSEKIVNDLLSLYHGIHIDKDKLTTPKQFEYFCIVDFKQKNNLHIDVFKLIEELAL